MAKNNEKAEEIQTIKIRLMNEKTMVGEVRATTPIAVTIIMDGNQYTIPWTSILYTLEEVKKI